MSIANFQTETDIEEAVLAIAKLMEKWGLKKDEWMLGKNVSLYYAGVFKNPDELNRDITLHVETAKLPWKVSETGRSIVPPAGSQYLQDYLTLQREANLSVDLWPAPDPYSDLSFLKEKNQYLDLKGKSINIETLGKHLDRRLNISKEMDRKTKEEIRNFYYANEERYKERLEHFAKIIAVAKKENSPEILEKAQTLQDYYEKLIKLAYPELFEKVSHNVKDLKGMNVVPDVASIKGKVMLADTLKDRYNLDKNLIYVFSHFRPADSHFAHSAKAIITEGGGITSHAAIICRELRLPCIVGVKGVTQILKNNQEVEIDFQKGQIKILN